MWLCGNLSPRTMLLNYKRLQRPSQSGRIFYSCSKEKKMERLRHDLYLEQIHSSFPVFPSVNFLLSFLKISIHSNQGRRLFFRTRHQSFKAFCPFTYGELYCTKVSVCCMFFDRRFNIRYQFPNGGQSDSVSVPHLRPIRRSQSFVVVVVCCCCFCTL